jgi:Na+-translocating ferredoxin:NAD+ oxidoreductase RnfA subunit
MDALRSSLHELGVALMNSEIVYSFLMGMGWFFLVGWAIALVLTCATVFRQDRTAALAGLPKEIRGNKLIMKQDARV